MENELMNNVPTVEPVIEEPVIELEVVEEIVEEPVIEEPVMEPATKVVVNAVVSGAKKLNVRKNPAKDAEVLCVIAEGNELTVSLEESTNGFYKVYTECNGVSIEGYCVETFVTLK